MPARAPRGHLFKLLQHLQGVTVHRLGKNSIYLNADKVADSAAVRPGDRLRIRDTTLRLNGGPGVAESETESETESSSATPPGPGGR